MASGILSASLNVRITQNRRGCYYFLTNSNMTKYLVTYKRKHNFEMTTKPLNVIEKNLFERELLEDESVEYAYCTEIHIIK